MQHLLVLNIRSYKLCTIIQQSKRTWINNFLLVDLIRERLASYTLETYIIPHNLHCYYEAASEIEILLREWYCTIAWKIYLALCYESWWNLTKKLLILAFQSIWKPTKFTWVGLDIDFFFFFLHRIMKRRDDFFAVISIEENWMTIKKSYSIMAN